MSVTNGQITQSMTYDGVGNTSSSKLTNNTDSKYIESSAVYTADGNHVQSITDAAGGTTSYNYGMGNTVMWELPVSVTTANGTVTASEYDEIGRTKKTEIENTTNLLYNYTKGLPGTVQRTANRNGVNISQTYSLTYDAFGNTTGINVGSKNLASYEYEDYRLLKKQIYCFICRTFFNLTTERH